MASDDSGIEAKSYLDFIGSSLPPIKRDPQNDIEFARNSGFQFSVRSSTAESTGDVESLRAEITRLQYCLENQPHQKVAGKSGRQSSQKLVSGSQFKLPQREVAPCQNCESLEKSLKKAKEQIRGLKLNSTRLEEKIHDLLRHRSDEGNNDLSAILESKATLLKKYESQELELMSWKSRCIEAEKNFKLSDAALGTVTADFNSMKQKNSDLEKEMLSINKARDIILVDLDKATVRIAALEAALRDLDTKRSESIIREETSKDEEIQRLKQEIDLRDKRIQSCLEDVQTLTSVVSDGKATIRSLEASRNLLKSSCDDLSKANERCQRDVRDLEVKLQDEIIKNNQSEKDKKEIKASLAESQRLVVSLEAEVERLKRDSSATKASADEAATNFRRVTEDSDKYRKALERAVTSSVRLCVVAPTVNVHLGDRKLRINKSGAGGVAELGLRDFIENEVLSQYCLLFKQETENSGPNGESIQEWVQQMLDRMQSAIEAHVNAAMDGSR